MFSLLVLDLACVGGLGINDSTVVGVVLPNGNGSVYRFALEVRTPKGTVLKYESLNTIQRFPADLGDSVELVIRTPEASVKTIRRTVKVAYRGQMVVVREDFRRIHYPPESARSVKRMVVPTKFCKGPNTVQWVNVMRVNSAEVERSVVLDSECKGEVSVLELPGVFVFTVFSDGSPVAVARAALVPNVGVEELRPQFSALE